MQANGTRQATPVAKGTKKARGQRTWPPRVRLVDARRITAAVAEPFSGTQAASRCAGAALPEGRRTAPPLDLCRTRPQAAVYARGHRAALHATAPPSPRRVASRLRSTSASDLDVLSGMVAANRPAVEPRYSVAALLVALPTMAAELWGFHAVGHDDGNRPWTVIGVAAAVVTCALLSVVLARWGLQHPRQTGSRSRIFGQSVLVLAWLSTVAPMLVLVSVFGYALSGGGS